MEDILKICIIMILYLSVITILMLTSAIPEIIIGIAYACLIPLLFVCILMFDIL